VIDGYTPIDILGAAAVADTPAKPAGTDALS